MEQRFCSARLPDAMACALACTAFAMVTARTAAAQDVTSVVEAPNVSVLGIHVKADDVRGVDDGQGIQFAMAWQLSDVTHLQVAASYINFDTGAPATDFYRSILAMAAASLRGQSGMRVEVAGHTDDRGSDSYNLELSRRRAQSVSEYLGALGIQSSRMEVRGYGEAQPMDMNSTDTGRERNRRVEFRVLSN